jgi:DNA end-binding protein Ku
MAKQLVGSLESKFDPDSYRDEYREELLSMIERKAEGADVVESVSEAPTPTRAPDLMAALEESLAAVKGEPLAAGAKSKPAKPATRKASSRSKSSSNGKTSGKRTTKAKSSPAKKTAAKSK